MTDEEKRAAIEALVDAEPHIDDCPAPEFLARVRSMGNRIRALLDDAPSVEWRDVLMSGVASVDGWTLVAQENESGTWDATIYSAAGDRCVSFDLPSRYAAQRRAVALYVALRGVT